MDQTGWSPAPIVDFDLHGIVGVRLLNASPADIAGVEGQIGPLQGPIARVPDITVEFRESVAHGPLSFIEWNHSAFDKDGFYLLHPVTAQPICCLQFDEIGRSCNLVVQRGLGSVPLLVYYVTFTALAKGYVPVHASAFVHEEAGILVAGWSKGGKTEALLAFDSFGGRYVGDEWMLLSPNGDRMFGIPERMRLWDWHLRQLPHVAAGVSRRRRMGFRAVRALDRAARLMRVPAVESMMSAVKRRLWVRLPPSAVFCTPLSNYSAQLTKVFLFVSSPLPDIAIEPVNPLDVAERMAWSIHYEQTPMLLAYQAYRFAFPQGRNSIVEGAYEQERELLRSAVAGKPAYLIRHPYPVSLERLYHVMRPYVDEQLEPSSELPTAVATY